MEQLLFSSALLPFTAAAIALLVIGALEFMSLLIFGVAGITHGVDAVCDVDVDFNGAPAFLDWVLIRGVPLTVSLAVIFAGFSMAGFISQGFSLQLTGEYLGTWPSVAAGVFGASLAVRLIGFTLNKLNLLDGEESITTFIGLKAEMQEQAEPGRPGLAHIRDKHGTLHLVLVEPSMPGDSFEKRQSVELVEQDSSRGLFKAR